MNAIGPTNSDVRVWEQLEEKVGYISFFGNFHDNVLAGFPRSKAKLEPFGAVIKKKDDEVVEEIVPAVVVAVVDEKHVAAEIEKSEDESEEESTDEESEDDVSYYEGVNQLKLTFDENTSFDEVFAAQEKPADDKAAAAKKAAQEERLSSALGKIAALKKMASLTETAAPKATAKKSAAEEIPREEEIAQTSDTIPENEVADEKKVASEKSIPAEETAPAESACKKTGPETAIEETSPKMPSNVKDDNIIVEDSDTEAPSTGNVTYEDSSELTMDDSELLETPVTANTSFQADHDEASEEKGSTKEIGHVSFSDNNDYADDGGEFSYFPSLCSYFL